MQEVQRQTGTYKEQEAVANVSNHHAKEYKIK